MVMLNAFVETAPNPPIPILFFQTNDFLAWFNQQSSSLQTWVKANGFQAKPGMICLVPKENSELQMVLYGIPDYDDFWFFGDLANRLPGGVFYLDNRAAKLSSAQLERAQMAWG